MYVSGAILAAQAAGETLYQLSEGRLLAAGQWAVIGAAEAAVSKILFQAENFKPTQEVNQAPAKEGEPESEPQEPQTSFLEAPEARR